MRPITVVVVSTNALIRNGIQQVVMKSDIPIEVAAVCATFREAYEFLDQRRAQVIIIDYSLPRSTNLAQEVKKLRARQANLAVLMIAQRPTATLLRLLREHGVRGMLHKDDDLERGLLSAIPMIADGGFSVSPRISRLLDVQRPLPDELQQRDVDVLQLTADGFQVKEISSHLGLASKTIYRTLQMLREVYDAHSNAQLIDIAHQKKLLDMEDEDDQA
jgi:two-component system response regulator DesR